MSHDHGPSTATCTDQCGDGQTTVVPVREIDEIVARIGREKHNVIAILHAIQEKYRWLPREALKRVCEVSDITPSQIIGVSTFYGQFRHTPVGEHMLRVCTGTACHVAGASAVKEAFRDNLGISDANQDTDAERRFTVTEVACLGCCSLAPVVQIEEEIFGYIGTEKTQWLLREVMARKDNKPEWAEGLDEDGPLPEGCPEIRIALDSACIAQGADKIYQQLRQQLRDNGAQVRVKPVGWVGHSARSPLVEVIKPGFEPIVYSQVEPRDAADIVNRHFPSKNMLKRFGNTVSRALDSMLTDDNWRPIEKRVLAPKAEESAAFFGRQVRIATEHAGEMDPLDFEEYQKRGGFTALAKALKEMKPEQIVEEVKKSGLRGRGGGGFPTGIKWSLAAASPGPDKFVICNGDEGDPGAFMDRMVLESYPYRVIEGMAIAARAIGANNCVFYIRAEYPLACKRIQAAIEKCQAEGLLGDNIMGTGFNLKMWIVKGAGAFICGEETAMIASIEGGRGMPTPRPPYPAQKGLFGKPTLINNVETLAMVSYIIRNGASSFNKYGTAGSKGTKVFALAGKVKRGGLIEVPMGTTMRQVVYEIGGGAPNGRKVKAVQIGGPSGGMIPERLFDTPIDYETLKDLGAMMGSGGLVVLDDTDCMVDMARYFLTFAKEECCGQCSIGRIGTTRLLEMLQRITKGKGKKKDLVELESLGSVVKRGSLCGLCKTAPNPILTTLMYFKEEYEEHLQGRCRAGKCTELVHYVIKDHCIGCTICAQNCPTDAIPLTPFRKHDIIDERCIRCDICFQVCPEDAIHIE